MANEETSMYDSSDMCVKRQSKKHSTTTMKRKSASKKQTDLWLLFQQADSRAFSKREKEREREAGSHMDCHALC